MTTDPPRADERACPFCDSTGQVRRMLWESDGWRILRCERCTMVFLANPPDYKALADDQAWEDSYRREQQERRRREPLLHALQEAIRPVRRRLRPNKLRSLVLTYVPDGSLLDLGCGTGHRIPRCLDGADRCIVPYGIEIEPDPALEADTTYRRYGGRVWQRPVLHGLRELDSNSMHGALLYAYLEHEIQPAPVLQELHRVLAAQSHIIVKVPNYASLNRVFRGRRWCGYRLPDHVNYFTPATLRRLLELSGYRIARFAPRDRFAFSDNMWTVAKRIP